LPNLEAIVCRVTVEATGSQKAQCEPVEVMVNPTARSVVNNVTLKSGTNEIHASLFEFHRNQHFTAQNCFAATSPTTVYTMFGFTVGRPVRRSQKLFSATYRGFVTVVAMATWLRYRLFLRPENMAGGLKAHHRPWAA
jgi:hypothetical protein